MNNGAIASGIRLFDMFSLKPINILIPSIVDIIINYQNILAIIKGEITISDIIVNQAVGKIINLARGPFRKMLIEASDGSIKLFGKNGFGGRSWFSEINKYGRKIEKMVVAFHDANKAGPHLDIHIGKISFIKKIPANANKALRRGDADAVKKDIQKLLNTRKIIPQNLDHSPGNARLSWENGGSGINGYGAGKTRRIIMDEPVEIIKNDGETAVIYAPKINRYHNIFFHRLNEKMSAVGSILKEPAGLKDKLHLISTNSKDQFLKMVDPKTITKKEDGAAAHIVMTPKGTTIWSPRISRVSGRRIEYTGKLPEIARMTGNFVGMGELKFLKNGKYLTAAEIGGILNSAEIRPLNVKPEILLYRADKVNGKDVSHLGFWDNRKLQEAIKNDFIKVVRLVGPNFNKGEGLVGVPKNGSILNGYKLKFVTDPDDWEVIGNELKYGPTGRTAGVMWFKSLKSGKKFKLGPGQLGSEDFVKNLIGKNLNGLVAKVVSKNGYEGRSSKFIEWHSDKGLETNL